MAALNNHGGWNVRRGIRELLPSAFCTFVLQNAYLATEKRDFVVPQMGTTKGEKTKMVPKVGTMNNTERDKDGTQKGYHK